MVINVFSVKILKISENPLIPTSEVGIYKLKTKILLFFLVNCVVEILFSYFFSWFVSMFSFFFYLNLNFFLGPQCVFFLLLLNVAFSWLKACFLSFLSKSFFYKSSSVYKIIHKSQFLVEFRTWNLAYSVVCFFMDFRLILKLPSKTAKLPR